MKPPPFEYFEASGLAEALDLLAAHGSDGKVLAGGQSLVPLLNFRIMRPACVIDVNRLDELASIRIEDGSLRIGALTRLATLEHSPEVAAHVPLLVEAVRHVGHPQVRNRGTVGGSVAHADPAAELPTALAALGASFVTLSRRGARRLGFEEFFAGIFTSALAPDELLTEIDVPIPAPSTGWAFCEFARRHGDFALGGAAVLVTLGPGGVCETAAIALLAAGPTPAHAPAAEAWLTGRRLDGGTTSEAARRAVTDAEPSGDVHGSPAFRRHVLEVVVGRALDRAAERAGVSA